MAGLVAAARARELGASPVVLEKGDRPGGSMLLSSGVVWRHRSFDDFHRECPAGDPLLQRPIIDGLDDALDWLESLGVAPVAAETTNPLTVGRRYDPRALTNALVRAAGDVRLQAPFVEAQVLATGGFAARLAREQGLLLRANPWSTGDGLDFGLARRAAVSAGMDEYYGRALPGDVPEDEFVSASQLYARHALVLDDTGTDLGEAAWHESDIVQRFPGGAAWYVVDAAALRGADALRHGRGADRRRSRRWEATSVPPRSSRFRFRRRRSSFSLRSPLSACAQPSRTRSAGFAWTTRPASSIAMASPSPDCTPRVQTRAASSPAATEAASPPRWCSAASPPRPRSADVCSDVGAPQASWVNAHRRRSPGSGDGPILLTRRSVSPFSIVAPTAGG